MHWFSIGPKSTFSKRYDIKLVLTESGAVPIGKVECRPYLVDWNRDGHDDVVVLMMVDKTDYTDESVDYMHDFKYGWEILINTESANRKRQIEKGRVASLGSKEKSPSQDSWSLGSSVDYEMELKLYPSKLKVPQDIGGCAFKDFDGDGNFDMVYFQNSKEEGANILWRKNLTSKGKPKFSAPQKIYESKNPIRSIAVVDFDGDGVTEVAMNSDGKLQLLTQNR